VACDQWGVPFIIFLVIAVIGYVIVGSISGGGVIISVFDWTSVLLCQVSVLGAGPRDQDRVLWHSRCALVVLWTLLSSWCSCGDCEGGIWCDGGIHH